MNIILIKRYRAIAANLVNNLYTKGVAFFKFSSTNKGSIAFAKNAIADIKNKTTSNALSIILLAKTVLLKSSMGINNNKTTPKLQNTEKVVMHSNIILNIIGQVITYGIAFGKAHSNDNSLLIKCDGHHAITVPGKVNIYSIFYDNASPKIVDLIILNNIKNVIATFKSRNNIKTSNAIHGYYVSVISKNLNSLSVMLKNSIDIIIAYMISSKIHGNAQVAVMQTTDTPLIMFNEFNGYLSPTLENLIKLKATMTSDFSMFANGILKFMGTEISGEIDGNLTSYAKINLVESLNTDSDLHSNLKAVGTAGLIEYGDPIAWKEQIQNGTELYIRSVYTISSENSEVYIR